MTNNNPLQTKGFHPYGDLIGLTFNKIEKGFSQCSLNIDTKLMNPHGFLHGGVMYSMADTGMGAALHSLLKEDELCATIEVKIAYFKPVKEGILNCETKVIHKSKNIGVLESEILNNQNLVSKAFGTFSIYKINR